MEISKEYVESVIKRIFEYMKNPIKGIKNIPDWDWATLILVQCFVSLCSGVLAGILQLSFFAFLAGLIMVPIVSLVTAIVSSIFLYYTFLLLAQRELPARQLFTLVILANIPFFIFQTIAPLFPPITLFGFFFTAFILIVGLSENFNLDKKLVIRVIATLCVIYLLIWAWGRIDSYLLEKNSL